MTEKNVEHFWINNLSKKEMLINELNSIHKKPKNIAMIGGMGAGKTTISNLFVENKGYKRFSFADEVKKIAQIILERPLDKGLDRELLQDIGQIIKRSIYELSVEDNYKLHLWLKNEKFHQYYIYNKLFEPDFFVKKLENNKEFQDYASKGLAVVDDSRFLIETDFLKRYNFKIVKLDTPIELRVYRLLMRDGIVKKEWFDNGSEAEINSIHYDLMVTEKCLAYNEIKGINLSPKRIYNLIVDELNI